MNIDIYMDTIKLYLNNLTSPRPTGYMDADVTVQLKHISILKEYLITNKVNLINLGEEINDKALSLFYLFFEVIDHFGINKTDKKVQCATYNLGMEFLNIKGLLKKVNLINPEGTLIFYDRISFLNYQYMLYDELFPDLFSNVETLCLLSSTNNEVMKINEATCIFHTAITRIIINNERQIIKEDQSVHLNRAMEHVLKCIIDYISIGTNNITDSFKTTLWELIYRTEISSHFFYGIDEFIKNISQFIAPVNRNHQEGRLALRIALISAEMELRQVLIAIKCFQFPKVIQICKNILIELRLNNYSASDHRGVGCTCFNGFSMKFNEICHEIILIFEEMSIWSYFNAHCAGEIIVNVLTTVFNLPEKKGWDGPWLKLNDRVKNLVNIMSNFEESNTFSKLFNP